MGKSAFLPPRGDLSEEISHFPARPRETSRMWRGVSKKSSAPPAPTLAPYIQRRSSLSVVRDVLQPDHPSAADTGPLAHIHQVGDCWGVNCTCDHLTLTRHRDKAPGFPRGGKYPNSALLGRFSSRTCRMVHTEDDGCACPFPTPGGSPVTAHPS